MKEFFTTLYGKAIAVLTIIALVLGIAAEVISIQTAYYSMEVKKVEAIKAEGANRSTQEILNGKETTLLTKPHRSLQELKHDLAAALPNVPQEEINQRAINACKRANGLDSPICKE